MDRQIKEKFKKINSLLKNAKTVVMAAHKYPDGDALGAALALHIFFKNESKIQSVPYFPEAPSNFKFLPGFLEIKKSFPKNKIDFLIGLDYGDFKRLGIDGKAIPDDKIITIDHHLPSDHRGVLQIVRPDYSSTSEIVYSFLKNNRVKINKEIAVCLLAGIYTDTGGFRHAATSLETLKAAADLMSCGASLLKVIRETTTMGSISVLKIWGRVLSRIKQDKKTGMAYSWVSANDFSGRTQENFSVGDLAADISMRSGAPFTLLLIENKPKEFKGSLRSEPHYNIDVAKIARILGGGGHRLSAGFEERGRLNEIVKKVIKASLKK